MAFVVKYLLILAREAANPEAQDTRFSTISSLVIWSVVVVSSLQLVFSALRLLCTVSLLLIVFN